jgi:cyclic-di-GMP phosphodiesterase, flagellum assembly factor TipF
MLACMSAMLNIIFLVFYAALAAGAAYGLWTFGLASAPVALIAGVISYLLAGGAHLALQLAGTKKDHDEALAEYEARIAALETRTGTMREEIVGMATAVENRLDDRERQIITEIRVLEGLVRGVESHMDQEPELLAHEVVDPNRPRHEDPNFVQTVRAALEDNRIDVYLQPIVSLPQRKLRFYEALSRLRDSKGEIIMPKEYLYVAEPAGLMTVIDNLLLFRCVQVVRQLAKKNPGIAIFCNISGHSLRDHAFFPQFIEYMEANADLASQLVFEFAQSELQSCSAQEELSLERLAALGFGFSMDRVSSLDVDFHALSRFNFRFVKIDAKMMTAGTGVAGAPIQAGDLKTFARRHGIDLIAEKIEDEKTVVDVLDYDVDFGQGFLFGEPEPMDEVLRHAGMRGDLSPKTQRPPRIMA